MVDMIASSDDAGVISGSGCPSRLRLKPMSFNDRLVVCCAIGRRAYGYSMPCWRKREQSSHRTREFRPHQSIK